jgi:hypothetical protein
MILMVVYANSVPFPHLVSEMAGDLLPEIAGLTPDFCCLMIITTKECYNRKQNRSPKRYFFSGRYSRAERWLDPWRVPFE